MSVDNGAIAIGYPFYDDMESGIAPWKFQSPWGLTETSANSTSTSWTDSPSGSYANNANASLQIAINLSQAQMPVLEYWQHYTFRVNTDYGYVEVSTNDGANWTRVSFVTGISGGWVNEKVDLSEYAGQASVLIRFRLVSNSSLTSDGWYIDDVSIDETTYPPISYPLLDDFDTSTTDANWITVKGGVKTYQRGVDGQDKCPSKRPAYMSPLLPAMVSDHSVLTAERFMGGLSASMYFLAVARCIRSSRATPRIDSPLCLAF